MKENLEILYTREAIDEKIAEIAREISARYAACGASELLCVWLMEGARNFAEALASRLTFNADLFALKVSSYGDAMVSSGKLVIDGEFPDVKGRRVLLIDDILDTGLTAKTLIAEFKSRGASEVKTCFLLNKISKNRGLVKPDFQGFEIPDLYVVGFGMDSAGRYRDLSDICVLR